MLDKYPDISITIIKVNGPKYTNEKERCQTA